MLVAVPYLVGAAAWGAYIVQDLAEFKRQFLGHSLGWGRLRGLGDPLTAIEREAGRFAWYYGLRPNASWPIRLKAMLPIGYLVGLLLAVAVPAIRRQPLVKVALPLLGVQLLVMTFFEGTKQYHYIVHIVPTLVTLLVAALWTLWQGQVKYRLSLTVAVALLLAVQIGPTVFRFRQNLYFRDFVPTVEAVRPFVAQDLTLMCNAEFGIPFGFPRNIFDDPVFGYGRAQPPDVVVMSVSQYEANTALYAGNPDLSHYLTVTFPASYELIFEQGDYRIYKHRVK
jgi:hypothetical protein